MRSAKNAAFRGAFGDMASLVKHLPHYQEPVTLILLKGHLLVEEQLRGYIDRKLASPDKFKHDQFMFAKILMLCRALTPPQVKSWGFDAAKKLNDVRNEVAHELEPPALPSKLEDFVSFVEQRSKNCIFPPEKRSEARLHMAISDLHNELVHALRPMEN